jgi:hypothetical protein
MNPITLCLISATVMSLASSQATLKTQSWYFTPRRILVTSYNKVFVTFIPSDHVWAVVFAWSRTALPASHRMRHPTQQPLQGTRLQSSHVCSIQQFFRKLSRAEFGSHSWLLLKQGMA